MKYLIVLCAGLLATLGAQAQSLDLKIQIEDGLDDIRYELRVTRASDQDLRRTLDLIREARRSLRGEVIGGGPVRNEDLSCASRDNDGQNPYIRTIYSLQDRTVTRDTSIAYRSMQECRGAR